MRKLIYGGLFLTVVGMGFIGCKKEKVETQSNKSIEDTNVLKSPQLTDYGDAHNQVLDLYYSQNPIQLTFTQKVELIDSCLSIVEPNIPQGSFIALLNANPTHEDYLESLSQPGVNYEDAEIILNQISDDDGFSVNVYNYSIQILESYDAENENIFSVSKDIKQIESEILNDSDLSDQEKADLGKVISISLASIEYWQDNEIPNYEKAQGPSWIGADAAGGTTAITSGMAAWASTFGPWGGFIAVVGTAAVASAFS